MTVKITKPQINVREKLAELDKPSGIAGEAMLRAETPQEQQALVGVGRKNILINGAFQVWQRGTSSTAYSSSTRGYIADRWSHRFATTAERSTDVPSGEAFKYSFKVVVASTSPDAFIIQGVEDADRFAGQTVTFSYWIKPSETCTLRDDYFRSAQGTHNLEGGVWQRVTNTFVVPSDITANEFIYIQFPANKVITFYVTGVQLELGKVATPFEHRSYGEELALCQRYYQRITGGGYSWITEVQRHNNTGFRSVLHLPVPLRVVPSISYSNLAYWYNNGSLSTGTQSLGMGYTATGRTDISHLNLEYIPTSMTLTTNGNLSAMLSFTSAGGYLDFSSEL